MKSKNITFRDMEERIQKHLLPGKAIIVLGPRQSGQTTQIKRAFSVFDPTGKLTTPPP